ncbi:MAG: cytochrome c maturation protein CcmE [Ignavibacteriales bacterium]|jgi:cytochrome c-type biogenesis protein CcmE|nr:cytochrome c maturation protein CcmE [Ignavibacteriales bacterium]MBK7981297.1 cytochrome c maturation protein CcmE [Ignavibacteriota bacterium]
MKNKYIFGGIIIVVFLGIMSYLFTETNISYEENFTEVMNSSKTMKATGSWVKEKNYNMDNSKKEFSFYMKDYLGNEMKVIYNGTIPNNFESATSVVVTGKYKNGCFHADDILTKCPSKYEEQFDKSSKS